MKRLTLLALTGLILASCSSDDEDVSPALRGRLLDGNGDALPGMGIVVSYDIPFSPDTGDTLITEVITTDANHFWLSVPETELLTLTVHDRYTGALEDTVYYGLVEAGTWSIEWDCRDDYSRVIPAGMKFARISNGVSSSSFPFLFNADYSTVSPPFVWLSETDEEGRFELEEEQLAFGWQHIFTLIQEDGDLAGTWRLDRELKVWAVNDFGVLAVSPVIDLDVQGDTVLLLQAP
jgi:hypothetical protein